MTANELIKRLQQQVFQINTGDIPIILDGAAVDLVTQLCSRQDGSFYIHMYSLKLDPKVKDSKESEENEQHFTKSSDDEPRGIVCPDCGTTMKLQEDRAYTSIPPKYGYVCPKSGRLEFREKRIADEYSLTYSDDLENEVVAYWNMHSLANRAGRVSDLDFLNLAAKHFVEWQKERDDKELSEKIAASYQLGRSDQAKQDQQTIEVAEDHAMMAGMNKAKEEFDQKCQVCFDRDEVFRKGVLHAKEDIMKEAVEGYVEFTFIYSDGSSQVIRLTRPAQDGWKYIPIKSLKTLAAEVEEDDDERYVGRL